MRCQRQRPTRRQERSSLAENSSFLTRAQAANLWSTKSPPRRIGSEDVGGVGAMRYLAVPEMPRRGLIFSLFRRRYWAPEWHAVAESFPPPIKTLCGSQYSSEALWTWDQTMSGSRCPQCERLVLAVSGSPANPSLMPLERVGRVLVSRLHGRALVGLVAAGILIVVGVPLALVSAHSSTARGVTEHSALPPVAAIQAPSSSPTTTSVTI